MSAADVVNGVVDGVSVEGVEGVEGAVVAEGVVAATGSLAVAGAGEDNVAEATGFVMVVASAQHPRRCA